MATMSTSNGRGRFEMWFRSSVHGACPYKVRQPWIFSMKPGFLGYVNSFLPGSGIPTNVQEARLRWERNIPLLRGWPGEFPTLDQEEEARVAEAREVAAAILVGTVGGPDLQAPAALVAAVPGDASPEVVDLVTPAPSPSASLQLLADVSEAVMDVFNEEESAGDMTVDLVTPFHWLQWDHCWVEQAPDLSSWGVRCEARPAGRV